ncbi:MAG: FitA-like ribbon-helix-helix domain-containing protein [Rhodoplanes sp.]
MTDLLIRNIDPELKRRLEERARQHKLSISEVANTVLRAGLSVPTGQRRLGTEMFNLIRPEDRGDDLIFEAPGEFPEPPNFE